MKTMIIELILPERIGQVKLFSCFGSISEKKQNLTRNKRPDGNRSNFFHLESLSRKAGEHVLKAIRISILRHLREDLFYCRIISERGRTGQVPG